MLAGWLSDTWQLARRELVQFFRRPAGIAGMLTQPLVYLFLFGFGIKAAFKPDIGGFDYVAFIVPGLVVQRIISTSSRGGMGLIRDRHKGFLKEVLVAPVARSSIVFGLSVGHVTRAVLQGVILFGLGMWFGIAFGGDAAAPLRALMVLLLLYAIGSGLLALSHALAWKMDDAGDFALIASYTSMPLFLLSGAILPVSRLPAWLAIPIRANPLFYGVDAIRYFALGPSVAENPIWLDLAVVAVFVAVAYIVVLATIKTRQADD